MWPAIEPEQLRRPFRPMFDDRPKAVGIDDVDVQGVFDGRRQLLQGELLQKPQPPDVGPRPGAGISGLQTPSEDREALGQSPLLEGPGIIHPSGLPLQESQVMDRLKERPFPVPASQVPGHQSVFMDQTDLLDVATTRSLRWAYWIGNEYPLSSNRTSDWESTVRSPTRLASNDCFGSDRNRHSPATWTEFLHCLTVDRLNRTLRHPDEVKKLLSDVGGDSQSMINRCLELDSNLEDSNCLFDARKS